MGSVCTGEECLNDVPGAARPRGDPAQELPRCHPGAAWILVDMERSLDRRALLLLTGVAVLAGCTSSGSGPEADGQSSTGRQSPDSGAGGSGSAEAAPTDTTTTPTTQGQSGVATSTAGSLPTSPAASPHSSAAAPTWAPDANDVHPEVKQTAARYIETTTSPPVQIVFSQYGGILSSTASVLVVTHPWPPAADPASGATYDVRLVRSGSTWQVTENHPSTPAGPAASLSASARQVLANPRIELPPAARADIASGQVHDTVLRAMLALSNSYRLGISVVRSGHPINVFGTTRASDHPVGRAFDTWRIDDQPVVAASTPKALVTAYMRAVAALGSYNVGGPYQLAGATYFTDDTHHDHVHAGFTS